MRLGRAMVAEFPALVGGTAWMTSELVANLETLWKHDMAVNFFCLFFFWHTQVTKVTYAIYKFKTI